MDMTTLLVILLVVILLGGGWTYYGRPGPATAPGYSLTPVNGIVGVVVVVLLILWLTGHLPRLR